MCLDQANVVNFHLAVGYQSILLPVCPKVSILFYLHALISYNFHTYAKKGLNALVLTHISHTTETGHTEISKKNK